MNPVKRTISLGFTEKKVPEGQHICYIYNDDQERLKVMSQYLKSGQEAKEKLLYLVDAMTSGEMLEYLEQSGVDFNGAQPGEITVSDAGAAYCPSGFFNTEEMLAIVKDYHLGALEEGYVGSRGTGEMGWCLTEGRANHIDLMDYEARLTGLLEQYPYTACWQYDARQFDGQTIMDVLSVHPVMIVRGQIVQNPYFIEPEVFLKALHNRT